jgi:hypothetical protein
MKKSTMTSMLGSFSVAVLAAVLLLSSGCDWLFSKGSPPCTCQCTCLENNNPNQETEKCADSIVNPNDPNGCGDACMAEDTDGVNECSPPGVPPQKPQPTCGTPPTFFFCLVCGGEPQGCGTDISQAACTQSQATSIVDMTTSGDVDDDGDPCDLVVGQCGTAPPDECLQISVG